MNITRRLLPLGSPNNRLWPEGLSVILSVTTNSCLLVAMLAATGLQAAELALAEQAIAILDQNCSGCHDGQSHSLDVLDFDDLTAQRPGGRDRFITPGDPSTSYLWRLIETDVMPKDGEPLIEEEKEILKQWITAGSDFPDYGGGTREFIGESDVLAAIETHLARTNLEEREFIRYFSLHTLANNRQLTDQKLRLAAAGLAKAINSVSLKRNLIQVEAVDKDATIYAVNIRNLGWDEDNFAKWQSILAVYPYGSKPLRGESQNSFQNIKELFEIRGFFDGFPYIRADWFVSEVLRPPLYHSLIDSPQTVAELEEQEGFDHEQDFLRDQLVRSGMLKSNISTQPRMIDYHEGERGVWMSYDFLAQPTEDPERGDIIRFPLGPIFDDNPHNASAFEHAGGEVIYPLPNGLHAYLLLDGKGGRIDAGPIEIVADRSMISGTPEIVNGISCVSCHRHGMIDFNDQLSVGHAMTSREDIVKVDAIFDDKKMKRRMDDERTNYVRVLKRLIGPILQVDEDEDKSIESFPEPITAVAKMYQRDLDADQVAAELGLSDPKFLIQTIENQTELVSLGLGVLPRGGTIKRDHWEARGRNARESIFQRASRKFGFTPVSRLAVQ